MAQLRLQLTYKEREEYESKKSFYMLTTKDIATMLNCKQEDLFMCIRGHESHPEVVQAVREWIA